VLITAVDDDEGSISNRVRVATTLWNSAHARQGRNFPVSAMQSSSEVIMERSKPVNKELVVTAPSSIDITPGHSDLLESTAIPMSVKTAPSPTTVQDCELEEADNPNTGLEQALQSFVRYMVKFDLL